MEIIQKVQVKIRCISSLFSVTDMKKWTTITEENALVGFKILSIELGDINRQTIKL